MTFGIKKSLGIFVFTILLIFILLWKWPNNIFSSNTDFKISKSQQETLISDWINACKNRSLEDSCTNFLLKGDQNKYLTKDNYLIRSQLWMDFVYKSEEDSLINGLFCEKGYCVAKIRILNNSDVPWRHDLKLTLFAKQGQQIKQFDSTKITHFSQPLNPEANIETIAVFEMSNSNSNFDSGEIRLRDNVTDRSQFFMDICKVKNKKLEAVGLLAYENCARFHQYIYDLDEGYVPITKN